MNIFGSGIYLLGDATGGTVTGSGTSPFIPKWSGASALTDSQMGDDGTTVFIGASASSSTAIFDVQSTTKGQLFPRMTEVQRDAIVSPATGLWIYNTDTNKNNYYNGTMWVIVESSGAGGETLAETLTNGNVTGGTDIIVTSGDKIIASSGTMQLNLRLSADNELFLGSDPIGFAGFSLYGIESTVFEGSYFAFDNVYVTIQPNKAGAGRIASDTPIQIMQTGTTAMLVSNTTVSNVALGSDGGQFDANVNNAVIAGGNAITANLDYTLFAPQVALQSNANVFNGILVPTTLTASRTYTLQDASGTVAFLSDITGAVTITDDVIPRGDGTGIEDGTWNNVGNNIYPTTTGSNIGQDANRIGTIFMSSTIDYSSAINFDSGGSTFANLSTAGKLVLGSGTATAVGGLFNIKTADDFQIAQYHRDAPAGGASAGDTMVFRYYQNDTGDTPRIGADISMRAVTVTATTVPMSITLNGDLKVAPNGTGEVLVGVGIETIPHSGQFQIRGTGYAGTGPHLFVQGKDALNTSTNFSFTNTAGTIFSATNDGRQTITPKTGTTTDWRITNVAGTVDRITMGTQSTAGFLQVKNSGGVGILVNSSIPNTAGRLACNGIPLMVSIADTALSAGDFATVGGVGNNSSLLNTLIDDVVTNPTFGTANYLVVRQRDATNLNIAVQSWIDDANAVIASYGLEYNTTTVDSRFIWWEGTTELMSLDLNGVLQLDTKTAPASSATDAFLMYSADIVAGNASPHFRTEAGDIIKLYKVSTGWTVTNLTTDRVYDANSTTLNELADIVGTLIEDFKLTGLIAS